MAEEVASKRLSAAPICDPKITRTITLGLPTNRATSRPVRCVVDLLVQCMKEAVDQKAWLQGRWLGP